MILNGTFEAGNVGFSSEYIYSPTSIFGEGTYAIVDDANTVHPNFFCDEDHTTGSGLFMAINGSAVQNIKVWYLTMPAIQPNTDYQFSTWITSLHASNPAILQFSINGVLLGNPFQAYSSTCDWHQFFEVWNSGSSTSAAISIVNQNTATSGNDFALDDISFAKVNTYYDTTWVYVLPQYTSTFNANDLTCPDELVYVEYTGNAPDTANYQWNFGDAVIISGSGQGPYEVLWENTGIKEISLIINPDACPSASTINQVEVIDHPEAVITADATYIPYGTTTILHGTISGIPGPLEFSWEPASKLQDPQSLDPETVSLTETTIFTLTVSDESSNCSGQAEITISVTGGALGASAVANPNEICIGDNTQLYAIVSGGTGNFSFEWTSDPPGFSSDLSNPVVSPFVSTTYYLQVNDSLSIVQTNVDVTVHPLPLGNAGNDQVIPFGTNTQLNGSASGGSGSYTYHWEPADMLVDPDIPDPETHQLYQNTQFLLTVTDVVTGCIGEQNSMMVNLDGGPLSVIIFGNNEICKGENTILTASGSGGNPSGYSYQWTDDSGGSYPAESEIDVSPTSTSTFYVTLDDGFNQTNSEIDVTVNPTPEFKLSNGGTTYACPLDSVILIPSETQPDWSYLWSNGSTQESIKVGSSGIGYDTKTFSLTTSSEDECTYFEEVMVIFDFSYCLGTDELIDNRDFRIYPNPARGDLFLAAHKQIEGEVRIYNVFGTEMLNWKAVEVKTGGIIRFNVDEFPNGIYFLTIPGPISKSTLKFILIK